MTVSHVCRAASHRVRYRRHQQMVAEPEHHERDGIPLRHCDSGPAAGKPQLQPITADLLLSPAIPYRSFCIFKSSSFHCTKNS